MASRNQTLFIADLIYILLISSNQQMNLLQVLQIYPEDEAKKNIEDVRNALNLLYYEYLEMHDASIKEATSQKSGSSTGSTTSKPNEETSSSEWDAFGEFLKDDHVVTPSKSEIEVYLEEGVLQGNDKVNLNVLDWWNTHKLKYRVLSTMASDILAVPISTVASEATFSAGGRVIDPFRSTLAPSTVEMLLCGGDWIRQKYGIKKKLKKDDIPCEVLLPNGKKS
ncbi:hypothetical protein QVD17_40557 [Tagetes erecta]|uniref:HAT C-terminal dimerisation domain-containing protein n=1 Tax=Tagetes erecta TaxID=13708 RepID=A0AAD8JTZ1_TARER|nr:hypothetical protein QVD17_40557 [Tagetes erecta]